jgi:hypothetical protein
MVSDHAETVDFDCKDYSLIAKGMSSRPIESDERAIRLTFYGCKQNFLVGSSSDSYRHVRTSGRTIDRHSGLASSCPS